jgi:cell wall-associated NlpC family hydrolase
MELSKETLEQWNAYVLSEYPKEACAYVVNGKLKPVPNESETPNTTFKVDAIHRLRFKGKVQAFLHSHPYSLDDGFQRYPREWATHADMISWIADDIPWGICATEGEGVSRLLWYEDTRTHPLEKREFINGKYDCYSIIRDYYFSELGIELKNFPRGMYWWETDQDLYENGFREAGFKEVPFADAKVNDVILMKLTNTKVQHGGVITGNNAILHHVMHRLSGYDTLSKWSRQIVKVVRYYG